MWIQDNAHVHYNTGTIIVTPYEITQPWTPIKGKTCVHVFLNTTTHPITKFNLGTFCMSINGMSHLQTLLIQSKTKDRRGNCTCSVFKWWKYSTLTNCNGLFHSLFWIKIKRSVVLKGLEIFKCGMYRNECIALYQQSF